MRRARVGVRSDGLVRKTVGRKRGVVEVARGRRLGVVASRKAKDSMSKNGRRSRVRLVREGGR